MHKFVRDLVTEWRKLGLPLASETIVVAVSGGADSLSLLLALDDLRTRKKLHLRLVAAHFNHGLRRAASDADEEFVRHLAEQKGFELVVGHGPISTTGNLEQNARNARYDFLTRTAENLKAYGVTTAHTMNDQAETFLLNLIRGSGPDGLSGMNSIRDLNDAEKGRLDTETRAEIQDDDPIVAESPRLPFPAPILPFSRSPILIRPLLTWARREDTENFCRECGVDFRYDTMNEDMSFKRVRVRKILLPVLTDLNPKIVETLARTAGLMHNSGSPTYEGGVASDVADGVVLSDADGVRHKLNLRTDPPDSDDLPIKHLKTLDKPELYQTLRSWLRANRGDLRSIGLKHIESVERLINSPKSGRMVELPGGGTVSRKGGRLSFGNIGNIKVDK